MRRIIPFILSAVIFAAAFFLLFCKEEGFHQRHWAFPLESQGSLTVDPNPASCGSCHLQQFGSWKSTLHSRAIGPGFLWQLPRIGKHGSENCMNCHSPNPETKNLLLTRLGWGEVSDSAWKSGSEENGVQCASCHLRKGKVYGPFPKDGNKNRIFQNSNIPHEGFIPQKEFEESEFCKNCHQSPETAKQVNGKFLMDTYGQWRRSEFAKSNVQCQNCHMPDRKHEWKGISDPEMVKQGVQTSLQVLAKEEGAEIISELKNSGVGHLFPSYSVPKVYLEVWTEFVTGERKKISEKTLGWMLDLELQKEIFDTRLSPGESVLLRESLSKEEFSKLKRVEFIVTVDPKEYYKRMFQDNWNYKDTFLEDTKPWVLPYLKAALAEANSAKYELVRLEWRR
ncbi:multiheme c-type cytochrome [Leptospira saintgironsiae]|uniref:Cytochrome C554 and C-prime n=1 Tax=Leptospira saintgironsiae TaxID=2023183 RepID=A0A2M9Y877_9LEPT|nr:multiheme c-type cytochrome [Leptospira saintgironsiae]PJZ47778.1 cytochrome C554 and C-prime [Leptospira saintgironsiae]